MKNSSSGSLIRPAVGGLGYIDDARMPWEEPFPGIRMLVIYENSRAAETVTLFDAAPGAAIAVQVHRGVDWVLLLEGEIEDNAGPVPPGNLVRWAPGSRQSVWTPTGAKFLILFHGSTRTVWTARILPEYKA